MSLTLEDAARELYNRFVKEATKRYGAAVGPFREAMQEKVHAARAEYEEKVSPHRRQHELDVGAAYIEYQKFLKGEYVEAIPANG